MDPAALIRESVVRRLTWLLFLGQSLGSASYIAAGTVATIVGAELSGQPALAGLPLAIHLLGSALAAYPAARLMERWGRRAGLVLGYGIGAAGAVAAGLAVAGDSFVIFLAGYGAMGLARGFTDLARYAAGEMHPAAERGRAISVVVLGSTFGAIAGPALVAPTSSWAASLALNELAGSWFAGAALFCLSLLVTGLWLRPDPLTLAQDLADSEPAAAAATRRPLRVLMAVPGTRVAIAAMTLGQLVMMMVMSITSLHMTHGGHPLADVSGVMVAHTLGMFGLSTLTGRLSDRYGRAPVIIAGGLVLVVACLLAPLSQATGSLAVALFLLGLGWNFCAVAGAALLTDSLGLGERARMQGATDLLVGLVSAAGSLQSGFLFASIGFTWLNWISLAIALLPVVMALRLLAVASGRPKLRLGT